MKRHSAVDTDHAQAGETGLPLLHTWKSVYSFVLASFVLWLLLLIVLTRMFS